VVAVSLKKKRIETEDMEYEDVQDRDYKVDVMIGMWKYKDI